MFSLKIIHSPKVLRKQFLDSRGISDGVILSNAVYYSQPQRGGGLYSPEELPKFGLDDIKDMVDIDYRRLAKNILWKFDWGISSERFEQIVDDAYAKQWSQPWNSSEWYSTDITPIKHIGKNLYSLHLGYGPTMAFKNVALEFLPRLLDAIVETLMQELWRNKVLHVLWASSWDTINAAHHGVKWTKHIKSLFMLPARDPDTGKWPSKVQELQATHAIVDNSNALTLLVDTPFDPAQDIIKAINGEVFSKFKEEHWITSFNSINIARILAQTVYYFRAYAELVKQGVIQNGEEILFSIPSGNFGDALACMYAKWMWLPVKKIHIATNENDVLDECLRTGRYQPRDEKRVIVTNAPSQDIAKSSNFERAILLATGNNTAKVNQWFNVDLKEKGYFILDEPTLTVLRETFSSSTSTDNERFDSIRSIWKKYNHGIDPHTATGVVPWERWEFDQYGNTPIVAVETSHIAQFKDELQAQGIIVPGMDEFDETIHAMQQAKPEEWVHFLRLQLAHLSAEARVWKVMETVEHAARNIFPNRK